jgi:hypothetical protein
MAEEREVPDIYCDGLQIMLTPFDVVLQLTERVPPTASSSPKQRHAAVETTNNVVGNVRMSLEHAKVVSILLRKVLKNREDEQHGPINLLPEMCNQLGISLQEDW